MINELYKIGDLVSLHFEEPSAIGYNGIICEIKMIDPIWGYYCVSVYGSATVWAKAKNLIKQR